MSNWKEYKLAELYEISSGLSKPADQFGFGDPFLSFSDVFRNYFVPTKLGQLVNTNNKEQASCSVKKGDVFLTRTSETIEELGMSAVALKDYPRATFNGFTKRLRPKNNEVIFPRFIGYYLRSPYFRAEITAYSTLTTRASLNNGIIERLRIRVPDLQTQKKIASILSAYDDLIENNKQRIQVLEEMAEEIYKEWFVRLRFPGYQDSRFLDQEGLEVAHGTPGGLPEGWERVKLEAISENYSRKRKPLSSMVRREMQGNYPYYGAAKIIDRINDYIFDGKYLLLAEDGSVITSEGYPVLQFVNEKFWVSNHAHVLKGKNPISTEYLLLSLRRYSIIGHVTGAAQPKINKENLNRIPSLKPPAYVCEKFDRIITPIFDEVFILKKKNIILQETRDLLLPRLISGKLSVENLEMHPILT